MKHLPDSMERKQLLRYGLAGLSTTILSVISFHFLRRLLPDYRAANVLSILLTKSYAYLVNKLYVFRSRGLPPTKLIQELVAYIGARSATGLLDFFGVMGLVSIAKLNPDAAKLGMQALVILLNYILGKHVVFRRER